MLKELNDYNWAEVFGEGGSGNCHPIQPEPPPFDETTSSASFTREDVAFISGISEGERGERDWIVWGRLKDGRWFFARGGCDYSGWDCRASNSGDVASSLGDLVRFGMTDEERARFGLDEGLLAEVMKAQEDERAGKYFSGDGD